MHKCLFMHQCGSSPCYTWKNTAKVHVCIQMNVYLHMSWFYLYHYLIWYTRINSNEKSNVIQSWTVEDRVGVIGAHLTAVTEASASKEPRVVRTHPPITTHVLDVSRGSPGAGIEVQLEMWKGTQHCPSFREGGSGEWVLQGSSVTDSDGRSGALMGIVDDVAPGFYRISFNTGKHSPAGFFPYVSIVFEIKESQKSQHFHVPLLLSPFSFSTYRGS